MESIIAIVLQRLQERYNSHGEVSLQQEQPLQDNVFLRHRHITVTDIMPEHMRELIGESYTDLVRWLELGLAYDCEITFRLGFSVNKRTPPKLLLNWPVTVYDKGQRRLYAFSNRWIGDSDVRTCEKGAAIVLYRGQRLTIQAKDTAQAKQIECIEGIECYENR